MANRDIITRAGKGSDLTATDHDQNHKSFAGTVETQTGTTYTVLYTDQNKTIELNNASMVCTMPAISTLHSQIDTDNFNLTLINTNSSDATVSRSSTDTFLGGATSITLPQGQSVTLQTDSTGTIWNIISTKPEAPATANNLAMIDASGQIVDSLVESDGAGNITADVTGNADTATALATSRNFSITGDITAPAIGFTGAGDVTLNASIDAGVVDTAELATGAVTGIKLNAMTAGTEKISVYQGTITVTGAGTISTGFTKHAECRVGHSGTVRVSRTHDNTTMHTRVYRNGLTVSGISGQGGSATTYSDDISVSEGDLLQLYANCSSDGCAGDTISDLWVGVDAGIGIVGDWYIV